MRLWLALRSPSWNYRDYPSTCDPVTANAKNDTIKRTLRHVESLAAAYRHAPVLGGHWLQYLNRGAGLLAARLPDGVGLWAK
jgi:hypothetical protein